MKITEKIHRIRVDFKVTDAIERFVYLYILIGKKIHLIDTGVAGTEALIHNYLTNLGRDISETSHILLTHSHPDHIGSACAIKEQSDCHVFASAAEKDWIEQIDAQFSERPIPNFYTLVNLSTQLTQTIAEVDILALEDGITLRVIDTKGHSHGSLSFHWLEENALFTGDAIPVMGQIPIYTNAKDSLHSLEKILALKKIQLYLSAWDKVQNHQEATKNIENVIQYLKKIDQAVREALSKNDSLDKEKICQDTCLSLGMAYSPDNPVLMLFKKSILANLREIEKE